MIILLSPAKTLDYDTPAHITEHSQPGFLPQAQTLIDKLRTYSPQAIADLMKLSDTLAALNVARYASWQTPFDSSNAKPAALAFRGDVYAGLDAASLNQEDLLWAQERIRILSGLYGLLKPLDLMQAYRLEMGTRLANPQGKDLYAFWQPLVAPDLNRLLQDQSNSGKQHQEDPVLVNLASNEYFKAVDTKQLHARIIHPVFKDYKNGQYKVISFYAKKARGLMARWAITQRITRVEALQQFDSAGYYFNAAESTPDTWVFLRDTPQ